MYSEEQSNKRSVVRNGGMMRSIAASAYGELRKFKHDMPTFLECIVYGKDFALRFALTEEAEAVDGTRNLSSSDRHAMVCRLDRESTAENQCCRAGAAMVNARMQFNARAIPGNGLVLGADLQSFAFSLALIPSKAHMFVHWAMVFIIKSTFAESKNQERFGYFPCRR